MEQLANAHTSITKRFVCNIPLYFNREENSPDSLKLKFKSGKDRETKVKSQVVVRGKAGGSDEESGEDSDGWSIGGKC